MVISLITGCLLLAGNVLVLPALIANLFPVYIHLFIVGWITQLIFGVAWWMFPIIGYENGIVQKGSLKLSWALYVLLNIGLILRVISEPQVALNPTPTWVNLLLISSIIQMISGVIFAIILWPRVRPKKTKVRQVGGAKV